MPRVLIGSIAEMRVSISRAALLVKVTARTPPGVTLPVWISHAMRVVSTRVFPEPAPARISADWSGRVTAASCSGLRFSRRFCIRAFANARFYRTPRGRLLHSDPVVALRGLGLRLGAVDGELRVLFRFEIRDANRVDARLAGLPRNDLGRESGLAHLVVDAERLARSLGRSDRDLPLAAPGRHAVTRLLLGLGRHLLETVRGQGRDGPRQASLQRVEGEWLVQGERPLAGRRDLDLSLDQAHDLALPGRLAPDVGAADPGGHVVDGDADRALAGEPVERPGRKPESALGDEQRRLEDPVVA